MKLRAYLLMLFVVAVWGSTFVLIKSALADATPAAFNLIRMTLAFLLLDRDATVTVCHIHTRDLAAWTRQADILVSAAGRPGLITAEMVKAGAASIGPNPSSLAMIGI